MNVDSYEDQQNAILEYKKALNAACEQLKRLKEEKETIQGVYEEFKQHYEKLKKECNEISKRHMETIADKKRLEDEYEAQLRHLRGLLEQREKILDEQRTKALLPTDTDMLRAKIAREIEAPYKQKVDGMTQEMDKLESEMSDLRRQNVLLKSELDANNAEHERQLQDLKQRNKAQVSDLMAELQLLHERVDDTKDKEAIRLLKREVEEHKRKAMDSMKEVAELRKQRDELKLERSGLLIEQAKQLDQARLGERRAREEAEELTSKIQKAEEELTKELQAGVEKGEQIQQLNAAISSMKEKMQECDAELGQCRAQCDAAEGRAREREEAANAILRKAQDEDKEKYLSQREKKGKLQQELERLEAGLAGSEQARKEEVSTLEQRLEASEKERRVLGEQYNMLRKKLSDLQTGYENLKLNHIKALDTRDKLEDEIKKIQERHRNLLTKEQELATAKDHLEFSMKAMDEECRKLSDEKKQWSVERSELQAQLADLTQRLEGATKRTAEEVKKYKEKASEYKRKVRQANLKLQQMATKLAKVHVEVLSAPMPEFRQPMEVPRAEPVYEAARATPDVRQLESDVADTIARHGDMPMVPQTATAP